MFLSITFGVFIVLLFPAIPKKLVKYFVILLSFVFIYELLRIFYRTIFL